MWFENNNILYVIDNHIFYGWPKLVKNNQTVSKCKCLKYLIVSVLEQNVSLLMLVWTTIYKLKIT